MGDNNSIKVYSTPTCPFCKMVKEFLTSENAPFEDLDVTKDSEALAEMVRISGSRSVPVIVGCEQVVIGFDKNRLTQMVNCVKNRTTVET